MQSDRSIDLEGDSEIVELELADQNDPSPAKATRALAAAGDLSEADSAATFTLTIVALVLAAVAFVQMPRESVLRSDESAVPALQSDSGKEAISHLAGVPLNALRSYLDRPIVPYRYSTTRQMQRRFGDKAAGPFAGVTYTSLSVAEKLQFPITFKRKDSFESIIRDVSSRTDIPIDFQFQDLRAEGIQKVRIIEIDAEQQSIESVLCEALRQNNPEDRKSVV